VGGGQDVLHLLVPADVADLSGRHRGRALPRLQQQVVAVTATTAV
jgi:hypothetical protein